MRVGDSEHRLASTIGAYRSWANTTNRAVRMAPANAAGPNSLIWHAKKRFGPDTDWDALTPAQKQHCEADRAAWQLDFRRRGLQARKRKNDATALARNEAMRDHSDPLAPPRGSRFSNHHH